MDVIGFKICNEDLENQGNINYWSSKSYDKAENDIVDFYISATGGMPCKNMALTKKLSFRLPEGITIPELRNLGDKIHKNFGIECFQISIDRDTSMVNMLFDVVDRKTAQSVYLNVSDKKLLTTLIAKELHSNETDDDPASLRYKILLEYKEDPTIFSKYKSFLANTNIGTKGYTNLLDILNYMEHLCNARTITKSKGQKISKSQTKTP